MVITCPKLTTRFVRRKATQHMLQENAVKSNRQGHSLICRNGTSVLQAADRSLYTTFIYMETLHVGFLQGGRTFWKRPHSAVEQTRLCRTKAAHSVSSTTLRINADCDFVEGHICMLYSRQGFAYAALNRMQLNRMQLKRVQHALMTKSLSQILVQNQLKPVQHT